MLQQYHYNCSKMTATQ